jgi:hypothetical protein
MRWLHSAKQPILLRLPLWKVVFSSSRPKKFKMTNCETVEMFSLLGSFIVKLICITIVITIVIAFLTFTGAIFYTFWTQGSYRNPVIVTLISISAPILILTGAGFLVIFYSYWTQGSDQNPK